jgi:hypothetical protein
MMIQSTRQWVESDPFRVLRTQALEEGQTGQTQTNRGVLTITMTNVKAQEAVTQITSV